jgi:hypothetical protein
MLEMGDLRVGPFTLSFLMFFRHPEYLPFSASELRE